MVASFAFAIYCASLLGVEGFGKFSIAIFYFELFVSLAGTAVGILLTRELAQNPDRIRSLLASSFTLSTLLCLLSPLLMIPLGIQFNYSPDTIQAMGVGCLALIPATLSVVMEAVFVSDQRAEYVTAGTAIESLLRIGISFLVLSLGASFVAVIWVLALSRVLLLLIYIFNANRLGRFGLSFHWADFKSFLGDWRVFAAENWMATIYTSLDVLILSYVVGEISVGLYCAAWKLVRLGTVFAKSYTTAVFPVMSKLFGDEDARFGMLYRQTIRVMSIGAIPAAVVVGVLADRIMALLFNDEYTAAIPILRVLIWVMLPEFLNPFLSHALFAQGEQGKSMRVAAVSLTFNAIATLALVHNYGATGAALGTVGSGLLATGCYMLYLLTRNEIQVVMQNVARITLASIGVGFLLYNLQHLSWLPLGTAGVLTYLLLLILFQGIRWDELLRIKTVIFQPRVS
jgi:O-antigen/teichoic acid export membrane protein